VLVVFWWICQEQPDEPWREVTSRDYAFLDREFRPQDNPSIRSLKTTAKVRLFFKEVLIGTLSDLFGLYGAVERNLVGKSAPRPPKLDAKKSGRLSPAELEKIK
jgi:hypothetical protein